MGWRKAWVLSSSRAACSCSSGGSSARAWLGLYEPDGPWAWHPVMEDTLSNMQHIVTTWPGDVCAECWEAWQKHGVHECGHWPTE